MWHISAPLVATAPLLPPCWPGSSWPAASLRCQPRCPTCRPTLLWLPPRWRMRSHKLNLVSYSSKKSRKHSDFALQCIYFPFWSKHWFICIFHFYLSSDPCLATDCKYSNKFHFHCLFGNCKYVCKTSGKAESHCLDHINPNNNLVNIRDQFSYYSLQCLCPNQVSVQLDNSARSWITYCHFTEISKHEVCYLLEQCLRLFDSRLSQPLLSVFHLCRKRQSTHPSNACLYVNDVILTAAFSSQKRPI